MLKLPLFVRRTRFRKKYKLFYFTFSIFYDVHDSVLNVKLIFFGSKRKKFFTHAQDDLCK